MPIPINNANKPWLGKENTLEEAKFVQRIFAEAKP